MTADQNSSNYSDKYEIFIIMDNENYYDRTQNNKYEYGYAELQKV